MSESTTKGLFVTKIKELGYPQNQDVEENGIVWYKEDSYKDFDEYLTTCLQRASKSLSNKKGTPDFLIHCKKYNFYIVIECKDDISEHQKYSNIKQYIYGGIGNKTDRMNYAVNGVLHYSQYLNERCDVVAIAFSGNSTLSKVTSFYLPQKGQFEDLILLEDGDYNNSIVSAQDYFNIIKHYNNTGKTESVDYVFAQLSKYALACANFLRINNIPASNRAGFVSAIILALSNEQSRIFKSVKKSFTDMYFSKSGVFDDNISENTISDLFDSLKSLWRNVDKIPVNKQEILEQYYASILTNKLLSKVKGTDEKYFKYGNNVLSCCIYSIYENIISVYNRNKNLDIMGTFYTVFLKYAKGSAKEKGIVLTPKHITELFCDIAEFYLDKKFDEKTKILDICCGTGGFLISALQRIYDNINQKTISQIKKTEYMEVVQKKCLIGVDVEPEMFALSYANMRCHNDGKSSLYSCSSLLKDQTAKEGVAYINPNPAKNQKEELSLLEELKIERIPLDDGSFKIVEREIDVGMINPPYSLKSTDKKESNGEKELDFVYSMLEYLKEGGIGIAIVPMSCACASDKRLRQKILDKHTLLACMTMPSKLFQDSQVGTATCIMVFKAHRKHRENEDVVFMSRWIDDGFVAIPHNGRQNKRWDTVKHEWLEQLSPICKSNDLVFVKKPIKKTDGYFDECLAEAYVDTDWSVLSPELFIKQLKEYSLFKFGFSHNINCKEDNITLLLLNHFEDFLNKYSHSYNKESLELNMQTWEMVNIEVIFDLDKGKYIPSGTYDEGQVPLIKATKENNGISEMTNLKPMFVENCLTVGKVGMDVFYQDREFCCSHDVTVLMPKSKNFNKYCAMFIIALMGLEKYRWCYGRQIQKEACKTINLKMPVLLDESMKPILDKNQNYVPDYDYMERYIKSLPYSSGI